MLQSMQLTILQFFVYTYTNFQAYKEWMRKNFNGMSTIWMHKMKIQYNTWTFNNFI